MGLEITLARRNVTPTLRTLIQYLVTPTDGYPH